MGNRSMVFIVLVFPLLFIVESTCVTDIGRKLFHTNTCRTVDAPIIVGVDALTLDPIETNPLITLTTEGLILG